MPLEGLSRAAKASEKRSRWPSSHSGHLSTIWIGQQGTIYGFRGDKSYHSSDRLASVADFNATTTVGGLVPGLATECSAVQAGGQRVGGERASAALHVATVKGRLARDGAASNEVLIGALSRDGSSESRAEQRQERKGSLEMHGDNAWYGRPAVVDVILC
jgi:hypothetical protein